MTTPAPVVSYPADVAGVKPGIRTTEFWLTLAVDVAAFAAAIANVLPDKYAAIAATVSTSIYSVTRGVAKFGATSS